VIEVRVAAVSVALSALSACTPYQPPPAEPASPVEVIEEVGTTSPEKTIYPAGAWKTERTGKGPGGAEAGTGERTLRGPIEWLNDVPQVGAG
jgi:hypothetical protein